MILLLTKPLGLMEALRQVIAEYPKVSLLVVALGIILFFRAVVQAMPEPDSTNGKGYRFIYRLSHILAGYVLYALRAKFPQYVAPDAPGSDPTVKP